MVAGDELVGVRADDGADMSRTQKRINAAMRVGDEHLQRGGHEFMAGIDAEVAQARGDGVGGSYGDGRRGCLEADADEDDLALGVLAGDVERLHRRVHDPDIRARGARISEAAARTDHAYHVAEGGDDGSLFRDLDDGVEVGIGRYTHGTAGAGYEPDALGEQLPDAVAADGVRVGAADLHDRHRRRVRRGNLLGKLPAAVDDAHQDAPPSSAQRARTSSASCLSTLLMAKPACTSR